MNKATNNVTDFRKHLRSFEREIAERLSFETNCCGITLAQCHVLLELSGKDDVSIKELSESLELDKSTLSRTIDSLYKIGFIKRAENEEDRRFCKINLTDSGKKMAQSINNMCNAFYTELLNQIQEDKRENVIESIILLSNALKKMRNNDCCKKNLIMEK
ncbi:MAG TPA: MarR family transcriptional regulator [Spirochaetota bacterium]|nr:MarR family transcriptional regulator [Spirochaetota bacterium]